MHKNNEFYKEKEASYQKVAKQSGLGAPGPKLPLRRRRTFMISKLTYSIEEAAKRIGVGRNTIYALANAGKIPAIRIGRRYVINAELFDAWFKEQCKDRSNIPL